MNKPAVSKAQLKRAIEALEAMGKTVADIDLRPDGTFRLRLTPGGDGAQPSPIPDDEFSAWATEHGYN